MQQSIPAIAGVGPQDVRTQIAAIRSRGDELKLKLSDLEVRRLQLIDRRARLGGDVDPSAIEKQQASVQHDISAIKIQLESMDHELADLQTTRDMARVGMGPMT